MPEKPLHSSITIILLMPLMVFFIAIALTYFLGVDIINEYKIDKILHIIGGVIISFSIAGILRYLSGRAMITLQDEKMFLTIVFGLVCFAVIIWEIFEYFIDFEPEYLTYSDTITDMIFGLIGGLFGILFIRRSVFIKHKR